MKKHHVKLKRYRPIGGAVVGAALLLIGCTPLVAPSADNSTLPMTTPVVSTLTPADPATTGPTATDPAATEAPTTPAPQEEETTMPATPAGSTAPESATPVDQAKADLAGRLSIDVNTIEVVETQTVTWRDGSMGCAKPGMMYTQALIPGMRILLSVDGQEYEYHSGNDRAPFFCEKPTENSTTGA